MSDLVQILREMIPHGRVMTVSERAEADMAAKYAADEIERLRGAIEKIWQVAAYDDCDDRKAREWIENHARDYLDAKEAQSDV